MAQILNSCERLALQRASLKNNYLCQMQTILAAIQASAYIFMIKRIPQGFNKDVRFLFLYQILSLQKVTIMSLKICIFLNALVIELTSPNLLSQVLALLP